VTARDAVLDLTAALEAAGFHVAHTEQDVTPPCVYLELGATSDAGPPLDQAGQTMATVYAYLIPLKGLADCLVDADNCDRIYAAVSEMCWETLAGVKTSVSVAGELWPCHRFDCTLLGAAATATPPPPRSELPE
jgi:hypothetical protein